MTHARMFKWLGVDAVQWSVLVRIYLRMDLRAGGGPSRPNETASPWRGVLPYAGLLFLTTLGGVLMGVVAVRIPDVLLGMTIVTTYAVVNTGMIVLLDFSASILSPTDAAVLAARPVSSRTYFAARLTTILVYVSALALATSLVPALTYAGWRGLGWSALVAVMAAVVLSSVAGTILFTNGAMVLLRFVHPARIRRAASTLQLICASGFYVALYLASAESMPRVLRLSSEHSSWLWINPASWFAAWVPLVAGASRLDLRLAAAAAMALTIGCLPLAAGYLAREYGWQVAEIGSAGTAPQPRRRRRVEMPGFGRSEGRAVALLVRAQFRYDMRFRFAVLAILPLMMFYLFIDKAALADPFAHPHAFGAGGMLNMAIIFLPLTLHGVLHVSESWRAAWIFFSTPASPSGLVLGAKNVAAVYFLGGYIALLAAIWSWYYEAVWHAVVHALALGLFAHLLLQAAVMVSPSLPFATEPRRAQQSARLFGLIFFGGLAASLVSSLLPLVYARPLLAVTFFGLLLAGTVAMEMLLRRRVGTAMAELEFR